MSALQRTRLGVSCRDVGAGLVAGVAALLANVLFHATMLARIFLSDPSGAWSYFEWDLLTVAPFVVTPVAAVLAGTGVWRTVMPDEPTPLRGAGAGVVTAFVSLFGLSIVFGVLAGLTALSTAPFDAFGRFVTITVIVFVFGSILTATVIAPVGALVGYGYEWYLGRRREGSLES